MAKQGTLHKLAVMPLVDLAPFLAGDWERVCVCARRRGGLGMGFLYDLELV